MNFGFLLFNDLEELDLVGPWEIISMWSKHFNGPKNCLMIAENDGPVKCYNGMIITPPPKLCKCPTVGLLFGSRRDGYTKRSRK